MCADFPSTRALMTLPKAVSERLILMPSLSVAPVAPVLLCLSEPARSTRLSFPALMRYSPFYYSPVSMYMVKIEWERLDVAFIWVSATLRLPVPKFMARSISGIDLTIRQLRSLTKTPLFGSSLSSSFAGAPLPESTRRSWISSL